MSVTHKATVGRKAGHRPPLSYRSWANMRFRCLNPNQKKWHWYGGRGITICDRWNLYENFLEDMGEPEDGMTLERLDVNGNYEPKNCKWITLQAQQKNRSNTKYITTCGNVLHLKDACALYKISLSTVYCYASRQRLSHVEVFYDVLDKKLFGTQAFRS